MQDFSTGAPRRRGFVLCCVLLLVATQLPSVPAAQRSQRSTDKIALTERLVELENRLENLKDRAAAAPDDASLSAKIDDVLAEYDAVSAMLGGDSAPAASTSAEPAPPLRGVGPPDPPGCVSASATFVQSTPLTIPTGPAVVSSTNVVSGAGPWLYDLNLQTNLTHTFAADLDITLMSPAGTVVTLTTDNGAGNDDVFNGTIWDDDANPAGQVPYTTNSGMVTDHPYVNLTVASALVPEEAMAAFIGEDPNGTWTITISDDLTGDGGSLASWSLFVTTLPAPPDTMSTVATQSTPVAIPTGPAVVSSTLAVSSPSGSILDVDLTTNLTHTFAADLDITLMSPAGTIVTLTTDNGAGNDNVYNGTVWNDDANPAGQVPYTTNAGLVTDHPYVNLTTATPLVVEEAMGAFIGEDPNGTWTITISDDLTGDGGSLASWSLAITTASCSCMIMCPADVTQSNDPNQCGAVVNYPAPTTTGSCNTITCTPPSGSFFPVGTTLVTCVEDVIIPRPEGGPQPMCTFSVTVNDAQPPSITCPANIAQGNDANQCSAVVNYAAPTASDNCPGVMTACSPVSGSVFPVGSTTVTCTATDATANTATCSFSVTVNDTQLPTIMCPANITTAGTATANCLFTAVVNYAAPTVSDNCPGVGAPVCVPASGSTFTEGTTTVTCTVSDAAGNSSMCTFTVTVNTMGIFGVCVVDDLSGDSWRIVTDPMSMNFRQWRYTYAATGEIFCGTASHYAFVPRRSLTASDTDDAQFFMNANLSFGANTGTVLVVDFATGRQFVIRDRNLANTVCP